MKQLYFKSLFIDAHKGFGLIEVLVTIAISSILMLGAVSTAGKALSTVKGFELRDTSSGILLRSQEITRSPVDIQMREIVSETKGGTEVIRGDNFSYRLDIEPDGEGRNFSLSSVSSADSEIVSCPDINNPFSVPLDENYFLCNQVIVTVESVEQTDFGTEYVFRVKSIVVYEFNGVVYRDELINFRTESA